MNIFMIHPHDIFSDSEPWTSRIRNTARALVGAGHHVRLAYFPQKCADRNGAHDLPFELCPLSVSRRLSVSNIRAVMKHARWADIIHLQKCFAHAALPALYAHLFTGTPLHYDWDDWELMIYNAGHPARSIAYVLNRFETLLPKVANTITVASEALSERAIALGVPKEHIFDGHVCVDTDLFAPQPPCPILKETYGIDVPVVAYMGQLHDAQYVEQFIVAAEAIVHEDREDVMFMIIGEGRKRGALLKTVIEKGLADRVIFTGAVPHEEVPRYLSICDIAVACFEENEITRCKSPLKLVEYMACGKAVVASDVGDVSKMVHDCGVVVPPSDFRALRQAIRDLLRDPDRRMRCGARARAHVVKHYQWSQFVDTLMSAYAVALSSCNT